MENNKYGFCRSVKLSAPKALSSVTGCRMRMKERTRDDHSQTRESLPNCDSDGAFYFVRKVL